MERYKEPKDLKISDNEEEEEESSGLSDEL